MSSETTLGLIWTVMVAAYVCYVLTQRSALQTLLLSNISSLQDDGAYGADDWGAAAEQAEVQAGLVGDANDTEDAIIPHGEFVAAAVVVPLRKINCHITFHRL